LPDLPDKIRAFIALRMGAEIERAIAEFVGSVRKLRSGVRWVRTDNLHVTLRFLGDGVDRDLLPTLDEGLGRIAGTTPPFVLHALGVGAFPDFERPRVVWIGLDGEQLIHLAQKVESEVVRTGFVPEGRPYAPHLTIGRVRDLRGWLPIRSALKELLRHDFGAILISELILYRSILGGEASRYQAIGRYQLTGPSRS
jgi:RNA 2',3'-cyclic 3'-phosphodiesterase